MKHISCKIGRRGESVSRTSNYQPSPPHLEALEGVHLHATGCAGSLARDCERGREGGRERERGGEREGGRERERDRKSESPGLAYTGVP